MDKKQIIASQEEASKKEQPILSWQTGAYQRLAQFQFILPYQFLLLCKLMEVTPRQVLIDFMNNLSCDSWKRQGRDQAKEHLIEYFVAMGYGQNQYTIEDIREIFKEMDAIGLLWPEHADIKLVRLHSKWRNKYTTYWFNKWFGKTWRKVIR